MTIERELEVFDGFVKKMRTLILSKGNDYANTDRLSNFKEAGELSGSGAAKNCLNLIGTKVARIRNLMMYSSAPNHESEFDTLVDLANYAFLLHCIRLDAEEETPLWPQGEK